MLFLLLAIFSSSLISILMRVSSNRISANLSMLAINYFVCALLGFGYTGFHPAAPASPGFSTMLVLGILSGALYLGGFMLFQHNTRKNGIVLTSIFMKLGLLVPVVMSMVLFREVPTPIQIAGFCIAIFAIVLINLKKGASGNGFGFGLILMLLTCGGCDAMSKIYERMGPAPLSDSFLFCTFAVSCLLCAVLVVHKKEKPGMKEVLYGSLIGIPNFFSAKFLLGALTKLPAVVVYPSFSVATLLIVTLAGVVVFRERLSKIQWAALAAIIAALIFLNI
jgi:drug/metabolite transporter (DMT)-like permease